MIYSRESERYCAGESPRTRELPVATRILGIDKSREMCPCRSSNKSNATKQNSMAPIVLTKNFTFCSFHFMGR